MVDKNIIQKTIVDLHYNGSIDPFELQTQIGDWCTSNLSPDIAETLEQHAVRREYTRIEKLAVEINVEMKDDWLTDLAKQISESISKHLSDLSLKESNEFSYSGQTKEQVFFEALIFFLKNGYLPWWSDIKNGADFSEEFSSWIKKDPEKYMRTELYKLSRDEAVQQRITSQLHEDNFFSLIQLLYADAAVEVMNLRSDMVRIAPLLAAEKRSLMEMRIKRSFWSQSANINKAEAVEKVAEEYAAFIFSPELAGKLKNLQLESGILQQELKRIKEHDTKVTEPKNDSFEKPLPSLTKEEKYPGVQKVDAGESIYINNAGLIIIAPFLPAFFKKLGIVKQDEIMNASLACCLVNYLANGRETLAEFELVFAKILCGVGIKDPVSTAILFTGDQKNEANELLLSVIEYWNILKDTSVEGLQQSFLQREGKLTFNDGEWQLQVEQKGYDMLLQQLPWNISMIKLPWMEHLVKTEWVY